MGAAGPHRDEDDLSTAANMAIHFLIIGSLVVGIAIAVSCADAKGRLQWHALNYRWRAYYMRGSGAGPVYAQVGTAKAASSSGVHKFSCGKAKPKAARKGTRRERARLAPAEEVGDDEDEEDEEIEEPPVRAPRRSGRTKHVQNKTRAAKSLKAAPPASRKAAPCVPSLESDDSD